MESTLESTQGMAQPRRNHHTLGRLIGYHGCDRHLSEAIFSGVSTLLPSQNDYDWLGPGSYFWIDSPERALDWARVQKSIKTPSVIGAFIHPGLCLNLTDYGVMSELEHAFTTLRETLAQTKTALPQNRRLKDGVYLVRHLDCAVIKTVHELRKMSEQPAYDSVYGVFEEGPPLYPNSGFRKKTHVQLAVMNPNCIIGYFRVNGYA